MSKYVRKPRFEHHCLRCGEDFLSTSETPDQCNKCGDAFWDSDWGAHFKGRPRKAAALCSHGFEEAMRG